MGDTPTENFLKRHQHWLLAILSALLLFLSFPNVNFYPFAWIAMVPLFIALTRATDWKSAFWIGYLTGFLFFAGLLPAIALLYPYANIFATIYADIFVTIIAYLLLVGYTGLYFAVFAALMKFVPVRSGVLFPIAAACIWTALEWVRSWMITGFPWGSIGYSQWNNLPGIQVASLFSVHGISFVIVLFNAGIATVLCNRNQWRQEIHALVLPLILTIFCFGYGAFQLQNAEPFNRESNATAPADTETLNVALVPGNVSQLRKWDVNQFPAILQHYINLTYKASRETPDLVVWPETSIRSRALTGEWPRSYGRFSRMLRDTSLPILVGTANRGKTDEAIGKFSKDIDKRNEPIYNRVLSISPDGKIQGDYAKMHLVPFGEYVPLENLLPDFIPDFIQFEPFAHGKTVNLLPLFIVKDKTDTPKRTDGLFRDPKVFVVKDKMDTPKVEIGASICFESVFPDEFRRPVQKGARVMGIFTNDAWFKGTAFPELHLSMAPFRAIENRIAVFRCANGGFTCIVDKFGRITTPMITPNATHEVLIAPVPLLSSTEHQQTLYTRYGDWFPILCTLVCVGWFGTQLVRRRWWKRS